MDTRTELLRQAEKLFAQRGYDAVGVQEIVDAASVTKPTLYHYFGSKRGLLETILGNEFHFFNQLLREAANYQGDLPLTLRKIREGGQPMIQGDGLQTRDFIYVGDTVESTLKLALRDDIKGRVLNLGSGRETSIKAIIDGISAEVGYTGGIDWQPARAADVRRHWADVDAATALIGPVAPTGLEEGLKKTIAWYQGRPS